MRAGRPSASPVAHSNFQYSRWVLVEVAFAICRPQSHSQPNRQKLVSDVDLIAIGSSKRRIAFQNEQRSGLHTFRTSVQMHVGRVCSRDHWNPEKRLPAIHG
jgi:hypothetical protein